MNDATEDIATRLENILRTIKNAVWQSGGMELLNEVEREVLTCPHCGYVGEKIFSECPICGKDT